MGYYTRVLTTSGDSVPVALLTAALKKSGSTAVIQSDAQIGSNDWTQIMLTLPDGREIAMIERSTVEEGSLGESEIQEFEDGLADTMPKSGADWLRGFFQRVRCVYSFQHLRGSHSDDGFTALHAVRTTVWAQTA